MLFPIETLRAIVGGSSAIDVTRLHLSDAAGAEGFLDAYGFRWEDPADREDLEEIRRAALGFLERVLLAPDEAVPVAVREQADVRRLLLAVSSETPSRERSWACALLRVMHTVAHATSDLSSRYASAIEQQILGRFSPHLRESPDGLWFGDVPLVQFEARARKPLDSIVLKLLHKRENVAADIFDRLGVRFVTPTRLDALLVVRYLRRNNVVMFANIKPSRSKNSLVDIDALEKVLADDPDEATLRTLVQSWPYPERLADQENPNSSRRYHAIQFTGRQRVRIDDAEGVPTRFFFPFEVQILDEESYRESRAGFASHDEYKARQREVARKRVLGDLIP